MSPLASRSLLVATLVLASMTALEAQTTVTGRIFPVGNESTGIEGARIRLASAQPPFDRTTLTDAEGKYEVADVPLGTYQLTISRIGYVPATLDVTIDRTEPVRLTIGIVPQPVTLDPIKVDVESRLGPIAHLLADRPTNPRNVITQAAIRQRAAGAATAEDIVRRVRPGWMRHRGDTSTRIETEIIVYVNNLRRGPLTALETIPASLVYEIWLLDGLQATQRWGTGHAGGVIHVITLPPG